MSAREMFVGAVINATGLPYIYGGNGPDFYDCSGLVVGCMRKRWPDYADTTAAGLYEKYKSNIVIEKNIVPGCLLFYSKFRHVVACIRKLPGDILVLSGANGGTSHCTTVQKAFETHAIVGPELARIVDGKYRGWWQGGFCCAVDPFKDEI